MILLVILGWKEGKNIFIMIIEYDSISGFCKRKSIQLTAAEITNGVAKVNCPDKSSCLDGYTCCKKPNTKYGCCALPKAVCCADGVHCCPNGLECQPGGKQLETIRTFEFLSQNFQVVSIFVMMVYSQKCSFSARITSIEI